MKFSEKHGGGNSSAFEFVWKESLPRSLSEWKRLVCRVRKHLSDLSFRAMGSTAPNPPVAALCVVPLSKKKEVHLIGGATEPAGMRHAEIVCLDAFDRLCKENPGLYEKALLHFYVTLEPCTRQGRTPPCVERIEKYQGRIVHLHYFFSDPLLRLSAKNVLRGGKIRISQMEIGVPRAQENRKLNALHEKHGRLQKSSNLHPHRHSQASARGGNDLGFALQGFFQRNSRKRPRLHIKVARTKDGIMGLRERRLLISGQSALQFGMRLRAHTDAVLSGPGTIVCDNPSFNLRIADYGRRPLCQGEQASTDALLNHLLCSSESEAGYIQRHWPWHEPARIFLLGRYWSKADDFFCKQERISGETKKVALYYPMPSYGPVWREYEKKNKDFRVSDFGQIDRDPKKNFWTDFLEHLALDYNDVLIEAGPGLLSAIFPYLEAKDRVYILESKKTFLEILSCEGQGGGAFTAAPKNKGMEKSHIQKNKETIWDSANKSKQTLVRFPKDDWINVEEQSIVDLGEDILYFYQVE